MIAPVASSFYITGGTVPRDAACYIPRQADTDLLEGLRQGQFCYILTSRQMGKSSLMVRTATTLRQEGVTCVILDLTAIGQNLDPERWYGGLLNQLGQHVGLEDELDDFWLAPSSLGPMHRFMQALQQVVVKRCSNNIVLFIDEIDAVRSLPFSADEFFAGIRECYNKRSEKPEFARLTFCLLGVATPSDLIRDTRTTPFNIGRRIELADFTLTEAAVLKIGLSSQGAGAKDAQAARLLSRVFYWTGGHPYLTQRLCQAVMESKGCKESDVDRLCEALFLSTGARERDDNLIFVRERLLRSEMDLAALLDVYGKMRSGKHVPNDEASPLVSTLRLSGIAKAAERWLVVRNRIYAHVFDRVWVRNNMPYAELWRQQAAYRRGIARAVTLSCVILLAMAALTGYALYQKQAADAETRKTKRLAAELSTALGQARDNETRANNNARAEKQAAALALATASQRDIALKDAEARKRLSDRLLYIATLALIPQDYERGEFAGMRELLKQTKDSPYRGFEWGYWNRLGNPSCLTLRGHTGLVLSVAFSPDGRRVVTGSDDRTARVWDTATGRSLFQIKGHRREVLSVAFSPDGRRIVTASADKTVRVWETATGRPIFALPAQPDVVNAAAFSPDGREILTGCGDGTVRVWDSAGHERRKIQAHIGGVSSVGWLPEQGLIVTGGHDSRVKVWFAETGQELPMVQGHSGFVTSVSYSAGLILSAGEDHLAILTDITTQHSISLRGHTGWIYSAALSTDGSRVVTGSADGTACLWDASNARLLMTVSANAGGVRAVAFSPDGRRIAAGNEDGTTTLWEVGPGQILNHTGAIRAAALSPDGQFVVTAGDNGAAGPLATVWDAATGRPVRNLKSHTRTLNAAAFSPDGRWIVTGADDGRAIVWEAATGRIRLTLKATAEAVFAVAFSSDGRRIVTGCADGKARVWDAATGHLALTLTMRGTVQQGRRPHVNAVAFCPDGRRIVTAGSDCMATVWDAATGREILTLKGHSDAINAVAVSRDGRWIVTGSQDRAAKVWDAATGKEARSLLGHTGAVFSVACSRDGLRILTAGEDGVAKLWDAETGRQLLTLKGHAGAIHSAVWSPDNRRIVTGSGDGKAIVWRSY